MFNKCSRNKSGLRSDCTDCRKKYAKENKEMISLKDKIRRSTRKESASIYGAEYRKNNKEKIAKVKKAYAKKNAEKLKEYHKNFRANNKELIYKLDKQYRETHKENALKYQREYRKLHKDKILKRYNNWCNNNKDKISIISQRRITRKKNLPATLTVEQWQKIKEYFNNKCAYCGKEKPLAQEHFIALSKGGEYSQNNIIPSCINCNSSKSNKDFFEWYPRHRYYSKKREKIILKFLNYSNKEQQLKII